MNLENVNTTSSITTNIDKKMGYSKAILQAIKPDEASFFERPLSPAKAAMISSVASGEDCVMHIDNTSSPSCRRVQADGRHRKSLSCDLTDKRMTNDINLEKKSQSLHQIDTPIDSTSRANSTLDCSTTSSLRRGADTNRTASMRSTSSRSSKDKESLVESIPFKVCAAVLLACAKAEVKTLNELLKQHPHLINYAYPNCFRLTCLHVAARCGHIALVRQLVGYGANLNARDDNWQTPAHLAARANQFNVVRLLFTLGADGSLVDAYGRTAQSYLYNGESLKFDNQLMRTPLSTLGSSIHNTIAGISGFGAMATGSASETNVSGYGDAIGYRSMPSSLLSNGTTTIGGHHFSFQRMGSLRPLRRQVNKVKELFTFQP